MRFGLGSELEEWLHRRHLFVPAAILVALLSVLFVLLVYAYTASTPECDQTTIEEECRLNVEFN